MEPAFWLNKAQKLFGEENELPRKVIDDINKFIENKDIDNLAQYVANLERSTWLEKLVTLRTAGLLTGIPKTDLKNITSNVVLKALDDIADTTFVRGLDSLYSLLSKTRTTDIKFSDLLKSWGQFSTGAREGLDFLKTGISTGKFADKKIPYKQAFNKFSENPVEKTLAKYTDIVFRRLEAEDRPFKAMGYAKSLIDQANIAGKNARLKGKELDEFVDKMIKNPTKEMDAKAKEFARYITLQSDNIINNVWKTLYNKSLGFSSAAKTKTYPNKIVKKVAEEVASIPTLLLNLISPFNRVASNLILRPIEYSPAGFIKGLWSAASGNQAAAVKATGRALLGTLIMGGIYELYKGGKVKFETPELDESKKETQ